MEEATRLSYLALLGIEQWRLRDDPALAASAAQLATAAVPAPSAAPRVAEQRVAERRVAEPQRAAPPPAATTPTPPPDAEIAANESKPVATGLRIGCAFLELPDGLLLVAAYANPAAPGLAEGEYTLLRNVAAALAPGHALPAPDEYSWPPPGVRLPGVDRPGVAEAALLEFLARYRKRNVRDVAVFDEALAAVLAPLCERAGIGAPLSLPSLGAMNAQAELKRDCWNRLKPLKRNPPA